jgi:outer membrane protein assembly factor BamB
VATREECGKYFSKEEPFQEGRYWFGGHTVASENAWGALRALDPGTGQLRWEFKHVSPPMAGILSTAGSLVLSGDMEGNFMAFDARKGQNLWHVQTGAAIVASPMTYSVKGSNTSLSPLKVCSLYSVFPRSHQNLVARLLDQKPYRRNTSSYRAQRGDARKRSLG